MTMYLLCLCIYRTCSEQSQQYRLFRKGDIHLRSLRRQISVSREGEVSAFDAEIEGQTVIVRFYRSHQVNEKNM
jgi:hypothetical protein